MIVTIRDIARRSGVSVSTASRALNKKSDVSKETRASVLAVARELHYAVNLHARALTGATSKTLGFIIYDTSTAFHATVARSVEDVATAKGYSLIVCNAGGKPEAELRAHQMLREKRVDGVLVNSVQSGPEPLRRLLAEGVPFVLLNRRLADVECDYVLVDYQRGVDMATSHLLELGHRRILIQTANPDHPPVHERVQGYRDALARHGVAFDERLVVTCTADMGSGYDRILGAMTNLRPRPTAILGYNDLWTIPVLKALHELRLRIPDDVAIVGHSDLEFAQYLTPPLSSVAQQVYSMGQQGANILFRKITWSDDQPWSLQQVCLEPRLVVRESSGEHVPVTDLPARVAEGMPVQ